MTTIYMYATVPSFFNAIRFAIAKVGRRNFKHHQDWRSRLVGCAVGNDLYCINVSTVREYYNAIYCGKLAQKKEAEMWVRDIQCILSESEKRRHAN